MGSRCKGRDWICGWSRGDSHGDRALEIELGAARERDAVAAELAAELAAACRDLARPEPGLAEALRPEGREDAVGPAGDGILVDAVIGGEVARDVIDTVAAGRGHQHASVRDLLDRRPVGLVLRHLLQMLIDRE